jgi:UDP-N-acetylglucosamine diphosphorylase/glucosamine-1-phosphate N-acetyltransferase
VTTPLAAVILAAGKGKRMNSDLPKVMLPVAGRPMLAHVVDVAHAVGADPIVAVVGHRREAVVEAFADAGIRFAPQEIQLGTGHAVAVAESALDGFTGDLLILSGDVPLLTAGQAQKLIDTHRATDATMTLLTCRMEKPEGYGRIVRNEAGAIVANVEAKDASSQELAIDEINAGVYVFDTTFIFPALARIDNDNAQGEYYLTDLVNMAVKEGRTVVGLVADDPVCATGANTPDELRLLEALYRERRGDSI